LSFTPNAGWPATVIIGASKDNSIFQNNVNNSLGGGAGIFSGSNNAASPRRGLLQFDVAASVPAGVKITGAQLTLYLGNAPNTNSYNIGLHRITADWGEGTAGSSSLVIVIGGTGNGFAAGPDDATWNQRFFGSTAWSNPGALGDVDPVASASAIVGGPIDNPHTWLSTAALVSDAQGWLDSPSSNFGWALINASETTNQSLKAFYSSEATQNSSGVQNSLDPAWRPTLTVRYIPEPGTALLVLVAAPLMASIAKRRLQDTRMCRYN
jgi:hypothetical protein